MVFKLEGEEYIELNKLLKRLSLVESGGHAKFCIIEGEVMVNGVKEQRLRKKLRAGDCIKFEENKIEIQ